MSEKEGKHYQRKNNKKKKEFYSLRSLVSEITGISDGEMGFDAAYKEIQRIVKTFQSLEGIGAGTLKTHKDMKESFVKATKAFYEDEEYQYILGKIRRDEDLSIEEHDMLIEHFVESTIIGISKEEETKLRQAVEWMLGDEYFKKAKHMRASVMEDIQLVDKIKHYPTKLQYMDEYIEALGEILSVWRENINMHILYEKAYERLIEKEPGLLPEEPLSPENTPPELLFKIFREMQSINEEDQ